MWLKGIRKCRQVRAAKQEGFVVNLTFHLAGWADLQNSSRRPI